MSSGKGFVKQAAFLVIAGLIVRVIGFVYRLFLTDLIGDMGNGIYGAGYNIYNFFLILSSAGLPAAISKMVSERRSLGQFKNAHQVFRISFFSAGILGLLASLLLAFFARPLSELVKNPLSIYSIWTLAPTIFIVALLSTFRGYFQGMNNTVPTAVSQVFEQIFNGFFSVFLAWLFLKNTERVEFGSAGGTAGTGIGALVALLTIAGIYYLALPRIKKKIASDKSQTLESSSKILKELAFTAFPIIAGTAIFSLTSLIDLQMVMSRLYAAGFDEDRTLSLYGMLSNKYITLTTLPVAIATALATAVLPNIAASYVKKEKALVEGKINLTLRLTMFITIPAATGLAVLSKQILLFLFPKYPEGSMLITVGSVSVIFLALAQVSTGMLQGIGKVKVPMIAAFFGGLIKIPLNYFLVAIPEIHVVGAVISTIACYVLASLIDFTVLRKTLKLKIDYIGAFVKPLFASFVMAMVCFVIYFFVSFLFPASDGARISNTVALLLSIFFGVLAYGVTMLLIKGFSRQELSMLPKGQQIVKKLESLGLMK